MVHTPRQPRRAQRTCGHRNAALQYTLPVTNLTRAVSILTLCCTLALFLVGCTPHQKSAGVYFPTAATWERRDPASQGFDPALLASAVAWAQTQETDWPKDFSSQERIFGRRLGPIPSSRASTNGLIIRHGYIVAEFGDTAAADPTYSVAKSYLSTIAGLTLDRGMIPSLDQPCSAVIRDGGYDSPHNSKITWRHHLTQTSEWQGELFGKDHRFIGEREYGSGAMTPREIKQPGTYYEYNDVRINRLSLSLLRLWKRPLPQVLKSEIMDPIGASSTWSWIPYDNAMVDIDGTPMPSVSGGTRWGGGLWISAQDHARFGLLMLRQGNWNGKQVLSTNWIAQATTPNTSPTCPGARPDYNMLWWLNTTGFWPAAPKSSYSAQGAGDNSIWVDPEHDLVIVWRWHKGGNTKAEFYRRVLEALKSKVPAQSTVR